MPDKQKKPENTAMKQMSIKTKSNKQANTFCSVEEIDIFGFKVCNTAIKSLQNSNVSYKRYVCLICWIINA